MRETGASCHQFCPVAKAMELLDERWTLLVLRELRYVLTPAGQELRPVIEALGTWGTRWIGELGDEDLDPQLLLWDMHRSIDHAATPAGRTVIQFRFPDMPARTRDWWLVITPGQADVCDTDPGYPVAVTLTATLRHLTQAWRGDLSWPEALRAGVMEVRGPEELRRAAATWFTLSPFAPVPRPAAKRPMALPARPCGHRTFITHAA